MTAPTAATGSYTGAWKRSVMAYTDQGVITHTEDPGHAISDEHVGWQGNWDATPQPDDVGPIAPDLDEYVALDFVLMPDGSVPVNQTPREDHGDGYGAHADPTEAAYAARRLHAHAIDQGAAAAEWSAPRPLQFTDEHYESITAESLDAPDDGVSTGGGIVAALQRGLNALRLNNPDGFRRGYGTVNPIDRDFWGVGQRELRHDHRPLAPNLVYASRQNIPASQASPYGWVFAQDARFQSAENPTVYTKDDPANFDTPVTMQPTAVSPVVGAGVWF